MLLFVNVQGLLVPRTCPVCPTVLPARACPSNAGMSEMVLLGQDIINNKYGGRERERFGEKL